MFCQYKDKLGEVGKGVHSYRIFNIAIVDVVATIVVALILKLIIPSANFFIILLFLFLLGILMHRIFCVRTTVDKIIFKE